MYIESIQLKDFRNYETLSIDLDKGTNILYGNNAQGKTNILEAVYLCGTSKSHRGSKDKEIVEFGKDESHIKTQLKKNDIGHRIDIHLRKSKSKKINGVFLLRITRKRNSSFFAHHVFPCSI